MSILKTLIMPITRNIVFLINILCMYVCMHVSVYIISEIINTMCLICKLEQINNTNIYEVFKNCLIYMRNNISLK